MTSNKKLREDVGKFAMPLQRVFTINNTNGDGEFVSGLFWSEISRGLLMGFGSSDEC